jgi:predicted NUDIX family phosphoesterase
MTSLATSPESTKKGDRQIRAEKLASRFKTSARRPVLVEFSGVPKAGKSSTLNQVHAFLRRCGFKSQILVERASESPIRDKKHSNFNVWTLCTTLAQILEKTQVPPHENDPDIFLIDRGLFDSICWLKLLVRLKRLTKEDSDCIHRFAMIPEWRNRICGVVVMLADSTDAMEREQGLLPVSTQGSIMNGPVLHKLRDITEEVVKELDLEFKTFVVDTSSNQLNSSARETAEKVVDKVLDWVEHELEEQILYTSKLSVQRFFSDGKKYLKDTEALSLLDSLRDSPSRPRNDIENDPDSVQLIGAVVIRDDQGRILQMRRHEADKGTLHDKFVVWAGGHVRQEDTEGGQDPIKQCAMREVKEELRLHLKDEELTYIGAVYVDEERAAQHVALVYEWKIPSEDVALAINKFEFVERGGNSLTSALEDIGDVKRQNNLEAWSTTILNHLTASE